MTMTTTSSITSTAATSDSSLTQAAGGQLGKDTFLKLLAAQLQHQNPLNPTDDQQFLAQMAQMSEVEQVTNMAKGQQEITRSQQMTEAVSLIGRTVTWLDANGSHDAVVDSVQAGANGPTVTAGGQSGLRPADLVEVR
jgi:flagellar basal-body rod modification protein FlgD